MSERSPLQALLAAVPQEGQVRWIGVRPLARGEILQLDTVEARRDAGLTGDHARPGHATRGRSPSSSGSIWR
jgi:hypothetical protein